VLTAAIMGGFLGYMFVRFGLYASILLHFITNYLSSFDWMRADILGIIVTLALLGIGFVSLGYIIHRVRKSKDAINSLPTFKNGFIKSG
jgi:membrane protease YdiL (CAAX protease family)